MLYFLSAVLGFPISCLLRFGFTCKRDDIGWTHGVVAWTAGEMIDLAALISSHSTTTGRGWRWNSRDNVWQMTRDLCEDVCQSIPRQHDAAFSQGLDGRNVVGWEDLSILFIPPATELPVTVGVIFRQGEALLPGPLFKARFS